MKVLFIAPRFHTNLYYQVQALQDAGHVVRVLVLYKGVSEFYEKIDLKVIGYSKLFLFLNKIFSKNKKNYLKSSFELRFGFPCFLKTRKELKIFKPDFIMLKGYEDLLSFVVLFSTLFTKIKTIMLIQTKKNHIAGNVFLLKVYLWFIEKVGVIAYFSPILETKEVFNKIGINNVFYVPFVFPAQDFFKKYFNKGFINIMTVGKFVERKEFLLLLEVFNELKKEGKKIKLNIFGEKADQEYFEKVQNFVSCNNLKNDVKIRCNVEYSKIIQEYKKNDLFILPSSAEPASYSVVEAMANKLPVICSDECGTRCYIEIGLNGYIFESRSKKDLKAKINLIIKEKKNLEKFGNESFDIIKNKHNKEEFLEKIKKILHKF